MAGYITKDDILDCLPLEFLIQLTDDESTGAVDDAKVSAAIEDAEGEADGYLATRYLTPLSPVPAAVKKFVTDIAVYNLYGRRDTVPPDREKRYDNAVKFFSNVSKGTVSLGAETPQPTVTNEQLTAETEVNERVFTRKDMSGF